MTLGRLLPSLRHFICLKAGDSPSSSSPMETSMTHLFPAWSFTCQYFNRVHAMAAVSTPSNKIYITYHISSEINHLVFLTSETIALFPVPQSW